MTSHPFRSRPSLIFAALAFLSLALPGQARAQTQEEGFRYAKSQGSPKVAKAAPVVKAAGPAELLKTFEVDQTGEPSGGLVPGVERIEWFADRMRWHFTVLNRTEARRGFLFDMRGSYVADEQGKTYAVTARELTDNMNRTHEKTIYSGVRFDFWLDFPAPRKGTKVFKVGLLGEFTDSFGKLKPFTVKLPEPIGGEPVVVRAEEPANKAENAGNGVQTGPERPNGMTRTPETGTMPSPQAMSEAAQAVRAAPAEGRRYEGNLFFAGGNSPAGILFEMRAADRLVSARIYTKTGSKKEPTKLVGAIYEDIASPGGLMFVFEDHAGVEYRFTLDGNTLSGQDGKGMRYTFLYKK